ncbi:hypothetical protein OpiT1DRAFT_05177 [Opitutaceae bacterium TAV1]|nr:hypothetical protein OpiT1DRAFT_05177 [Opitutaceae bacterium TAV1]
MKNQDHIQRPSGARRFLAFFGFSLVAALPWALMATARGAGTLTPVGSPQAPIQIRSHQNDASGYHVSEELPPSPSRRLR